MSEMYHYVDMNVKVAAMSLKIEIRLHAHQDDTNTPSGTEVIVMPI